MIENFRGISTFLFIYSTISRGTLVGKHCCRAIVNPTQLFARWVLGALSPGIRQPEREANGSPPCIGEVNNASCSPHALTVCTCTVQRDHVSSVKIESKFVFAEDCLHCDLNATGFENKDVAELMISDTGYMKICSEGIYVLNFWVKIRI